MLRRSRLATVTLALASLSAAACKETTRLFEQDDDGEGEAAGDGEVVLARRSPTKDESAADAEYLQKNSNFFFRVWDETFTRKLDDLPKAGEVPEDKRPHPGGYYPEGGGGTDVAMVGGKSPLAKWDDAFHGGTSTAAKWEREKHTTGPSWAGHCNGYSAGATRHPKEPTESVVRNGVTFSPQDIKALMAEVHMSADYEFLGGNRCDREGAVPLPGDRADKTKMDECEDVNPGTLHAAIANWIGRMKHGLVMDQYSGDQVWNYPLYKYNVVSQTTVTAAQARQLVGGSGAYEFNPSAVKFVQMRTQLGYVRALSGEVLESTTKPEVYQTYYTTFTIDYVLELNAAGEILGGEWIGDSQQKHPDFIWLPLDPLTPNGTRYMGNPQVDAKEVIKMWAESVGADPDNPPSDLKRPAADDSWGRWPAFDVTLDGGATGAVFAGKPAQLHVRRRDTLAAAGASLVILLNGSPLATLSGPDGSELKHTFEPGLGLNRLQLTWMSGGQKIEDQYLRFHVVR